MNPKEKFELITRNTQEIIGDQELKEILKKRDISIYLGTEISGRPHIGYFVPAMKMKDFLKAGCHVTMLLADIHAMLNNQKSTFEQLNPFFTFPKTSIIPSICQINFFLFI